MTGVQTCALPICINEARNQLGYSEIEGGDSHIIAYTDINQNTIEGSKDTESDDSSTQNE